MKKLNKVLIAIFLLVFLFEPLNIIGVRAADINKNIIILIDNSGSMKSTDPYRLSIAAASMLIDTVDEQTNMNIIAFGDAAEYSQKLSLKPSREELKSKLSGLSFSNNKTDLKEGIKEAISQLKEVQGEKMIIVLSDGKEDPKEGLTEQHMKELFQLGEEAHNSRIKVNCIGLSKDADEDTLLKISSSTGGDYFYSEIPSQLFTVFNKMLGSLSGFDTIAEFSTVSNLDKEIKLSSYIEEVVVKIASCDNTVPLTEVSFEDGTSANSKVGDKYKLYSFINNKNNTIRITSKDNENNYVIVQVKSKVHLNINSSSSNMSIPVKVPMDIQVNVQKNGDIKGLHMDMVEENIRNRIDFEGDQFKFNFKKEKPGDYPVFITVYDGEENIVAVKEIDINVKGYPPYYYTKALPEMVLTGNKFSIEVKQLDNIKGDSATGEVYVEYGDGYERYPFVLKDGVLDADITLKKAGDITISSRIDVIRDNKPYSYFLPYFNSKVIEKAVVELQSESYEKPFRTKDQVKLKLEVMNNSLYKNEKFFVYDDKENELGSFELDKNFKGSIAVPLKALGKGSNFTFMLKPENKEEVNVTEKINTNIRIISDGSYFLDRYKVLIILFLAVVIIVSALYMVCSLAYNHKVKNYETSIVVNYEIISLGVMDEKRIGLSYDKNIKYINIVNGVLNEDDPDNAIGEFKLVKPEGMKLIQGFKSLIKGNNLFRVDYSAMKEQYTEDEAPVATMEYTKGQRIIFREGNTNIVITFE